MKIVLLLLVTQQEDVVSTLFIILGCNAKEIIKFKSYSIWYLSLFILTQTGCADIFGKGASISQLTDGRISPEPTSRDCSTDPENRCKPGHALYPLYQQTCARTCGLCGK